MAGSGTRLPDDESSLRPSSSRYLLAESRKEQCPTGWSRGDQHDLKAGMFQLGRQQEVTNLKAGMFQLGRQQESETNAIVNRSSVPVESRGLAAERAWKNGYYLAGVTSRGAAWWQAGRPSTLGQV